MLESTCQNFCVLEFVCTASPYSATWMQRVKIRSRSDGDRFRSHSSAGGASGESSLLIHRWYSRGWWAARRIMQTIDLAMTVVMKCSEMDLSQCLRNFDSRISSRSFIAASFSAKDVDADRRNTYDPSNVVVMPARR